MHDLIGSPEDRFSLDAAHLFFVFQIFGSSITNAILSHDLLIVMYASGYVKFFSFPSILEKVKDGVRKNINNKNKELKDHKEVDVDDLISIFLPNHMLFLEASRV